MILDEDLKVLKGFSDTQYKLAQGFFIVFTILMLFITYSNLSLAITYGEALGLDFEGVLEMWNAEPELHKQYLGHEVLSIQRFSMAIINFGVALFFATSSVSMSKARSRNKRVLAALDNCGAINIDKNA